MERRSFERLRRPGNDPAIMEKLGTTPGKKNRPLVPQQVAANKPFFFFFFLCFFFKKKKNT